MPKVGETWTYRYSDFDGSGTSIGIVTEVHTDHFIICADGLDYWCGTEDIGVTVNPA